jgi:hypothetical protein
MENHQQKLQQLFRNWCDCGVNVTLPDAIDAFDAENLQWR